jgi:hypothetical protein
MAEHDIFLGDVGTWDAEVTITLGPGEPAQRSTGVAQNRLVGRWLVVDFKNETGFEGHGVYGWDAGRQAYVGVWVDSARTVLPLMTGRYDAATRTMTYDAEAQTPDGRTLRWREVTERPDDDTQRFRQIWPLPDGEHEMMTITYRRRRS